MKEKQMKKMLAGLGIAGLLSGAGLAIPGVSAAAGGSG